MNNKDITQKFIFENANIRGEMIRLTKSFRTIVNQHPYPEALQIFIGEMLAAVGLLRAIIKTEGRLTIQFQGSDPLKLVMAQCGNHFELRGLAQWQGQLTSDRLLEQLKSGVLAIMIDPEATTSRYQGIVSWQGESLAESIEGYFRDSEQLPTRLWLAVDETAVAGFLIQSLPSEGRKKQGVQEDDDWQHIVCLTETLTKKELLTLEPGQLLHKLYSEEDIRLFDPQPLAFGCTCSRERGEQAILMLGQSDAEQEIQDKQVIVVTCEFCNSEYTFDRVDVTKLFKNKNNTSNHLH